jgi:hypothetical protein
VIFFCPVVSVVAKLPKSLQGKEVIQMAEKEQSPCGCGCLPPPKKSSKTPKAEDKKPEK